MLKTVLPRSIPRILHSKPTISIPTTRLFSTSPTHLRKDPAMSSGPPKHEMAYFPQMTSSLPSTSGEFRRVLWTGLYSQVVLMTVPVGGDIGDEVHTVDQALTFTSGVGKATINGKDQDVKAGDLMVVPAGTQHQFVNTGPTPLVSVPHWVRFVGSRANVGDLIRSCIPFTRRPSTILRLFIRQKRKAMRKRRMGRMRRPSGRSSRRRRMRSRALSRRVESIEIVV